MLAAVPWCSDACVSCVVVSRDWRWWWRRIVLVRVGVAVVAAPAAHAAMSLLRASSPCLQCWRRLARAPPSLSSPSRFAFSTAPATAKAQGRRAFGKDYFWANPVLHETFGRSRRALQSGGKRDKSSETGSETGSDKSSENQGEAYPIAPDASSALTSVSSSLPRRSLKRVMATYLSLTKPRLSFLVVLSATAAYSLYPVPGLLAPAATAAPSLSTLTLLFLTSGTALCSASANAFNMLMEPQYDAQMSRTRNRPLVRKLISTRAATVFAVVCGVVGTGALYYGVNPTTAFLGAANILLYAGIYTPMKRMSVLNTWVGAVVGGIPPLMGWTAAASQYAHDGTWEELLFSEDSVGGWLCAGLLFAWQFPHFNALSWSIRTEYKNAGYRMLAWVNPAQNGRVALRYAVLMFPVCIGLSYCGVTDWSFVVTSSAINGWMAVKAWQFWKAEGHKGTARGLFWASVWHLPIVMVLAMAQKKGLGERLYTSVFGYDHVDDEDLYYEVDEEEKQSVALSGRGSL